MRYENRRAAKKVLEGRTYREVAREEKLPLVTVRRSVIQYCRLTGTPYPERPKGIRPAALDDRQRRVAMAIVDGQLSKAAAAKAARVHRHTVDLWVQKYTMEQRRA